ncbi:MAG: polyprenol monophosphomannose synthase [Bacteroidota bacterium]|nr:polyprenol monophosphomannose synthase [Bacteroidota bacterium]MDX5446755.1 polyprenol monophosphomannose synthase [Bacteroidota bacterium]
MAEKETLVIIPTYKEKENIEKILRKVMDLPLEFHVLVVDDNSPDGTGDIVRSLMVEFPGRIHLEVRQKKTGLGTAYIHGFRWALSEGYQFIFEMDADFSHNPEDLPRLYHEAAVNGFDLVVGSRYVKGVNVVNWPMSRVLLSFFASKYVRFITGIPIHDTTAGFICYRRKVLETINFDRIQFVGYAFQIEMKFKTWKYGFKLKEIPVIFTDRTAGKSKMTKGIISEAVFGVIKLKLASLFKKYPQAS